jgi:hypothetical protein
VKQTTLALTGILSATVLGCMMSPSAPRGMVPPPDAQGTATAPPQHTVDAPKPMPQDTDAAQLPPPPFQDPPLISQPPPEQAEFLDAYNKVGKPRITIFVNRSLEGTEMPANPGADTNNSEYLQKGQYDEGYAKSLDYEAIEDELADWIGCDGQVTIVSPTMARQKLTDAQVKDLQSGRPQVLAELAQELNTDILIQVQAHPTKQYRDSLHVRIIAEAINTKGGESLARAIDDAPLPLDKPGINKYTRFLARKLMADITSSWLLPPSANGPAGDATQPPPPEAPPPASAPPTQQPPTTAPAQ